MKQNELVRFGEIYRGHMEQWVEIGRFNGEWLKKKEAEAKTDIERATFYMNAFRAAILDDFVKATLAFGSPILRNSR